MPVKKRGFTLIELLVVMSIIGVLATIVLVSLNEARTKARDIRRIADIRQVTLALALYYDDFIEYPGVDECSADSWTTMLGLMQTYGYMTAVPLDPINVDPNVYMYGTDAVNNAQEYTLYARLEGHNSAHNSDVDGTSNGCLCGTNGPAEREFCIRP
jgi:type II secretion system protein G